MVTSVASCSILRATTENPNPWRYRSTAIVDTTIAVVGVALCSASLLYDVRKDDGPQVSTTMPMSTVGCLVPGLMALVYGVSAGYGWYQSRNE